MARPFLTQWFDTHIKPERTGPYETVTDGFQGWSCWNADKRRWGMQCATREEAMNMANSDGAEQNKRWRGHAQPYQGYEE